jgi:hypothetical protein
MMVLELDDCCSAALLADTTPAAVEEALDVFVVVSDMAASKSNMLVDGDGRGAHSCTRRKVVAVSSSDGGRNDTAAVGSSILLLALTVSAPVLVVAVVVVEIMNAVATINVMMAVAAKKNISATTTLEALATPIRPCCCCLVLVDDDDDLATIGIVLSTFSAASSVSAVCFVILLEQEVQAVESSGLWTISTSWDPDDL